MYENDMICAIATASGKGAIAIIRVSGKGVFDVLKEFFIPINSSKNITEVRGNTLHYGKIVENEHLIDEVILSVYRNPKSYTGEDLIEISCHASSYIQQQIIHLLLKNGVRLANPGEFTQRAFLNGKMDLSQAEAVADVIAASSKSAHQIAISQMRGGYAHELQDLRIKLLNFVSLLELELDFGEEDVEFADRTELNILSIELRNAISKLVKSFSVGNALKNGVPVAIVGEPNVGKSTLLNTLLNEDRALVSEIAGTTRDVIEDVVCIAGINFRFIDTAGIRHTTDVVETMGIEKTFEKIKQARIVIVLVDVVSDISEIKEHIAEIVKFTDEKNILLLVNKIDKISANHIPIKRNEWLNVNIADKVLFISAKNNDNINELENTLEAMAKGDFLSDDDVIVSNARHYSALKKALESINAVCEGINVGLTNDLIALEIRHVLHHLSEITGGAISNDEMLGNIFKNFCIGK